MASTTAVELAVIALGTLAIVGSYVAFLWVVVRDGEAAEAWSRSSIDRSEGEPEAGDG